MALDSARYAELFRSESQDQLATINRALLALEEEPGSAGAGADVFRAVHTIKGMSATMGYHAVAEYAHELETLLDRMRGSGGRMAPAVMDALFAAADALEAGVASASESAERTPAMSEALEKLGTAFGAVGPAASLAAAADGQSDPFDGPGVILRIRQSPGTTMPGVRAYLVARNLAAIGEVAAMSPPLELLQAAAAPQGFAVRLVTKASAAEIEAAVRAAGDIEAVQVDMAGRARQRPATPLGAAVGEPVSVGPRQVKIDLARLDTMMNLIGELVLARGRLLQIAAAIGDDALDDTVQATARLVRDLQGEITASRMVPVGQVFDRFPRMVRDAARSLGKDVRFEVEGRDIELDRALLDEMAEPIVHLLRNAVDHGLEGPQERALEGKPATGTLVLAASRDRSAVLVMVADDGRGIDRARVLERARAAGLVAPDKRELDDAELLRCIAHAGFSTKEAVTSLSGRGVGVDAVVNRVRALGGSVELRTVAGAGSTFTLRLPPTVAIIRALLARAGREHYVLPLTHVRETLAYDSQVVGQDDGRDVLTLRDEVLPLRDLRDLVHLDAPQVVGVEREIVVFERGGRRGGLIVDELVGQEDVVVKQFDPAHGALALFTGATILGDGVPALIMDLGSIL